MTIAKLRDYIFDTLTEIGARDAASETRIIMSEYADVQAVDLTVHGDKTADREAVLRVGSVLERRRSREPLQYILGRWDFMGLDFELSPDTLIPRQDTEILVETVLGDLHDGMRILDLCTGTGCILISLLKYSNDCMGVGTDISEGAIATAKVNAKRLLDDMTDVIFTVGDLYDAADGQFDIIVSNPPYIPSGVIGTLEPEVRDYEPLRALDGGTDGLELIRRIIDGAREHLVRGGSLYIETGYDQGAAVTGLMTDAGFINVKVYKDYAGLDRVVSGTRPILEGSVSAG
ncbi:MAG: peptide chain release factor N(5)-glutamine methyltransferase [Lachnospiraceae bacterium]|nr:peptide chain release factor N(5)-glutamine methyltransferase [Lachnospiraceae bacterium]